MRKKPITKKVKIGLRTYKIDPTNIDTLKGITEHGEEFQRVIDKYSNPNEENLNNLDELVECCIQQLDIVYGSGSGAKIWKYSKGSITVICDYVIEATNEFKRLSKLNKKAR